MRAGLAKSLGLSLLCALACGCGSSEGDGSDVEAGGTPSMGGSASGNAGSTNNGGKQSSGGSANNGGSGVGGSGGGPPCMELSSAEQTMLFEQAPHCTMTFDYQLEGSIEGGMVHDIRDDGYSGGFVNGTNGRFETPSATSAPDPTRVKIRFNWTRALAHGDSCTAVNGIVVPPTGNPRAGEELCITEGVVGFVDGGPDDGNFKFHLYGARVGADCSGEEVPIDLRGCM